MSSSNWKLLAAIGSTVAVVAAVVLAGMTLADSVAAVLARLTSFVHSVNALLQGNVLLQTILGTSIASAGLAWTRGIGSWLTGTTLHFVFTAVAISDVPTREYLLRFIRRKGVRWSTGASIYMKPTTQMTWAEQQLALQKGMGLGRAPRVLSLQPSFITLRMPIVLTVQSQWILLTYSDSGMTVYMCGRGRRDAVLAAIQEIVDNEADTEPGMPVARAAMFGLTGGADVRWTRLGDIPPRSKATLSLDGEMLEDMLTDARTFFLSVAQYHERQQPFRRGWLLHGPPGTGKSTTPQVLATELNLPVFMLTLANPSITDAALQTLLTAVPPESIILMEDVDVASGACKTRRHGGLQSDVAAAVAAAMECSAPVPTPRLTLSGLLNALDGLGAHVGHLLIMTTNAMESLDEALRRPGRMDRSFFLDYASTAQVCGMARARFPDADPADVVAIGDAVLPGWFSPAAISAFFMTCGSPAEVQTRIGDLERTRQGQANRTYPLLRDRSQEVGLYEKLWREGRERIFPLAVGSLSNSMETAMHSAIISMFPWPPFSVQPMLTTRIDFMLAFLTVFPSERRYAAQFATRMCDWLEAHPTLGIWTARLRTFFSMHCITPAEAVAEMDAWLLRYERRAGDHMEVVVTMRQWLFIQGCRMELLDEVRDILRGVGIVEVRDIDADRSHGFANTVPEDQIRVWQSCGLPCTIGGLRTRRKVVDVSYLAQKFMDIYQVSFPESLCAARSVCDADSFVMLSAENVADVLRTCYTLQECVRCIRETVAAAEGGKRACERPVAVTTPDGSGASGPLGVAPSRGSPGVFEGVEGVLVLVG